MWGLLKLASRLLRFRHSDTNWPKQQSVITNKSVRIRLGLAFCLVRTEINIRQTAVKHSYIWGLLLTLVVLWVLLYHRQVEMLDVFPESKNIHGAQKKKS